MRHCKQQIILGGILALLSPQPAWSGECQIANCVDLGYAKDAALTNCKVSVSCPFDASYKACLQYQLPDTCGERFYGLKICPENAICSTCNAFGQTFIKEINCNPGSVFMSDWTCVVDKCPAGYVKTVAECGSSGAGGWTLGSSTATSTGGNTCHNCMAKVCSTTEYPYTECLNSCYDYCQSGDNPKRYKCNSQQTYYASRCLYTIVKNGVWTSDFPSACCSYPYNGSTISCFQMKGRSVYTYPTSKANVTCGSIIKKDNDTYYYNYG